MPGGSSSGSAVAVARGIVPFALGTDTAGSGRVPAALNNIVGLKPSLGAISTTGLVPACRSLDCISVFALTVEDAWTAARVMAAYDADDAFSRPVAFERQGLPPKLRVGVPDARSLEFFGDQVAAAAFQRSLAALTDFDATCKGVDLAPFHEVARLLYTGPWVGERYAAIRSLIESNESVPASRDAADHRGRARVLGRRCVRRVLRARRLAPQHRRGLARHRRDARAVDPDHLYDATISPPIRSGRIRGSAPTRISSTCSISARSPCRVRSAPTAARPA